MCTAFFYVPRSQGKLGSIEVNNSVLIAELRNGIEVASSDDIVTSIAMMIGESACKLKRLTHSLGLNWPSSIDDID